MGDCVCWTWILGNILTCVTRGIFEVNNEMTSRLHTHICSAFLNVEESIPESFAVQLRSSHATAISLDDGSFGWESSGYGSCYSCHPAVPQWTHLNFRPHRSA